MRAQKIVEQDIRKCLRKLFLLTDEWYRSRGEMLVREHIENDGHEVLQHYGSVALGSQYDPHWDEGFWNSAHLTLNTREGFYDIIIDSDELERLRRDYTGGTTVRRLDGYTEELWKTKE